MHGPDAGSGRGTNNTHVLEGTALLLLTDPTAKGATYLRLGFDSRGMDQMTSVSLF